MQWNELEEWSENGEKLVSQYAVNNMVITDTTYTKKRIHKAVWVSPNQIYHICISKNLKISIPYLITNGWANIVPENHLMIIKLELKLENHWKVGEAAKLNFNPAGK